MKLDQLITKLKSWSILDFFIEIIVSMIGTLIILLILYFTPNIYFYSPYKETICTIIFLTFLGLFLFFNLHKFSSKIFNKKYSINIVIFVLLMSSILNFLFYTTDFPLYGINPNIDNWFRASFIQKISQDGLLHDFAYKDLSAFYSPFYWYILGISSKILNIPSYKFLKYGFLISWVILPILLYEFWNKVYDEKRSFVITTLSFTFIANFYGIYLVDHLIGFMFLIPYIIYYLENYKKKKFKFYTFAIAGLLGTILFLSFFLYFILIPLFYILNIMKNRKDFIRYKLKRLFLIFLILGAFSCFFWIPILLDLIKFGFESHQNHYLSNWMLELPLSSYFFPSLISIILFLGLVYIIKNYRYKKDIKTLLNLILTLFIIYFIGLIGILIGIPIMHSRFLDIILYVLLIGFSVFYTELFIFIRKNNKLKFLKIKSNFSNELMIFLLIIIIIYQNYSNTKNLYSSQAYENAIYDVIPQKEIDIIKNLDYKNKVFLTIHPEVVPYLPIYMFITHKIHFSHPCALHMQRIDFLRDLTKSNTSKDFYFKIINCRFDIINYFDIYDFNSTHLYFWAEIHNFPTYPTIERFYFSKQFFNNESFFETININGTNIYKTLIF